MGDSAFQSDRFVFRAPGRFATTARIAAFAVFHNLSGFFQAADLADAGHIIPVPLDAKFEVLIWVESLRTCVHAELSHGLFSLRFYLAGHLLKFNDYKLGRFQWRKANDDIDNSQVYIVLGGSFFIALNEVGIFRRGALKRTLAEKIVHEGADVKANLRPERFVVWFKYYPLSTAIKTLFNVERGASYWNIFPLGGKPIIPLKRSSAPNHSTACRKSAQTVNTQRVQFTVFGISERHAQLRHANQVSSQSRGSFPDTAGRIGASHDAGGGATRNEIFDLVVAQRIRLAKTWKVESGVVAGHAYISRQPVLRGIFPVPAGRGIDDHHGPSLLTVSGGRRQETLIDVVV